MFVASFLKWTAGQSWRAISWTTATSICAVIEMVRVGTLPH